MIFNMTDYPRSTTRQQWKRIWAERRHAERVLQDMVNRRIELLQRPLPFRIRREVLYQVTNPVMFMWPGL